MTFSFFSSHQVALRLMTLGLLLSSVLLACGDSDPGPPPPPPEFEFGLEVVVTNPGDEPIAGVPVLLDGAVVGFTDAAGRFEGYLVEAPGIEIELGVRAIDGYRIRTERSKIHQLSVSRGLEGNIRGIPITHRVEMISVRNEYLGWFSVTCDQYLDDKHCSNLPILLDGEEVARTDHRGIAQFVFPGVPEQEVTFTIQTPDLSPDENVMIEPRRPRFTAKLDHDATIFRASQEFTDPVARRAAERRPVRRAPRPRPRPATPTPAPQPDPPAPTGPPSLF